MTNVEVVVNVGLFNLEQNGVRSWTRGSKVRTFFLRRLHGIPINSLRFLFEGQDEPFTEKVFGL